jgi:hypothetical protein
VTLVRLVAYSNEGDAGKAIATIMGWANRNGWHVVGCQRTTLEKTYPAPDGTIMLPYELWVEAE